MNFVYKPPNCNQKPIAINATLAVKFSQQRVVLDPWYIFGGTKWTRTLFRLKHPWVYSKRGIKKVYRRVKRIFIKERSILCDSGKQ